MELRSFSKLDGISIERLNNIMDKVKNESMIVNLQEELISRKQMGN